MNLQKESFDGDGLTASPRVKFAKSANREKRICVVRIAYLSSGGSFRLIGFGSPNPFLPSRGKILFPPSLREEIFFFLSMTSSFLSWIIFSFSRIISPRSEGFESWKIR